MLYLNPPTSAQLKEYSDALIGKIKARLGKHVLPNALTVYLTDNKIKEIITATPQHLLDLHEELIRTVNGAFNAPEYNRYVEIKDEKRPDLTPIDQAIWDKYRYIEILRQIFDYKEILVASKATSYNLAKKLNRNTCTYCNRSYTITIALKDPNSNRHNDSGRITRPEFDHWFSKSKYPLLALSYYNLIPSCHICNSTIKGVEEFKLATHVHPYVDNSTTDNFKFSFYLKANNEPDVKIRVMPNSKMETTIKAFKIQEVYDAHSNMELKDLLDLKFKYSDDYIKTLIQVFGKSGITSAEAHRLIFGIEVTESEYHKRPFSKFKKDILDELQLIKRK